MDALINLLILYIVFTLFSSLFKKATSSKQAPKPQRPLTPPQTPVEDIQTKIGQYAQKIEQYITQAAPPGQRPPFPMPRASAPPSDSVESSAEAVPSSSEQLFSLPSETMAENILPYSQQESQISIAEPAARSESLLSLFAGRRSVLQGIILSEILGPPLSEQPSRFRKDV